MNLCNKMTEMRQCRERLMIDLAGANEWLDTPALLVDVTALEHNIRFMADMAQRHDVRLRPHGKTHKSIEVALRQMAAGAIGICCATLLEAEWFHDGGITGLLMTSPIAGPRKIQRAIQIAKRSDTIFAIDHAEVALQLNDAAARQGIVVPVLCELELGGQRTGQPDVRQAVQLARQIDGLSSLKLRGVQAYAPVVQHTRSKAARLLAAGAAADKLASFLSQLRASGHCTDIVSGSGTGAFEYDLPRGLYTEYQIGSYVFMDTEYRMIELGDTATQFQSSLFLAATVIGLQHEQVALIDAGQKTLFRGGPVPRCVSPGMEDTLCEFAGDEQIRIRGPAVSTLRIGDLVLLETTHCDPTVALHAELVAMLRGGEHQYWPIVHPEYHSQRT
ncbi:MAG: alanine racemase [Planctomycetota bacterium]